jgi:hypothetical protein
MSTLIAATTRVTAGGSNVPVTLRSVAVRDRFARGVGRPQRSGPGSAGGAAIESAQASLREHAVNWLALALLLSAWNVEARLADFAQPDALVARHDPAAPPRSSGLDWTERPATRWAQMAVSGVRVRQQQSDGRRGRNGLKCAT